MDMKWNSYDWDPKTEIASYFDDNDKFISSKHLPLMLKYDIKAAYYAALNFWIKAER